MATRVEKKLLVIVGQTASGKSALALELAEKFDGEIICADSRTIYKEADIGTAKPSASDQKRIRHHLLDIVNIGDPFSVADFKRLAEEAIVDIAARGKLPILVGGSGLYVDAVIYNYKFRSISDISAREEFKDASIDELQSELHSRNIELPENSRNKRYLIRAIEAGGQKHRNNTIRDNTLIIGLDVEIDDLKNRSQTRSKAMLQNGVLEETSRLSAKYGQNNAVMMAPAYIAFRGVIDGEYTTVEAIDQCVKLDTKLAKKQRTWFKRNKRIMWVKSDQAQSLVQKFLR